MKVALIVAFNDNTWERKTVDVPAGIVPDKFYRGSVKWNKSILKWAENKLELQTEGKPIEFLGVLDPNPEDE